MADNRNLAALTGNAAADEVTYSGDTAVVQLVRLVHVTGAEGSKVVSELVRLEDAAHTSGDPGIPLFGVVKTTLTALSGTDGDYVPPQFTPSGSLRVAVSEDEVGSIVDADSAAKVTINGKYIANGTTDCVPKFASIAAASSGNNTIVAAVTSKKIRVLAYMLSAAGTVNAKWQTGAGGTDLTGLKYCVANTDVVAPFNPVGWFETAAGVLLNLNLSAAIAVGGHITYIEI